MEIVFDKLSERDCQVIQSWLTGETRYHLSIEYEFYTSRKCKLRVSTIRTCESKERLTEAFLVALIRCVGKLSRKALKSFDKSDGADGND